MSTLKISPDLSFPPEAVSETFAFLAKRGAGKTYMAMVLCEEMLAANAQVVVLDPVSKWWGLRLDANGSRSGYKIPVLGGPRGDAPLSYRSGQVVARMVVEKRVSLVLDLLLFESDGQRRTFVTEFCRELFRLKSQESDPAPVHVFLEEAEEFVPQVFESADAPMIGAVKKMVKLGRNFGIGVSLISQRSADVNKRALSQTEYLCVLRTRAPQDLKAIKDWIEHTGAEEARKTMADLPTLPVGTAYVYGGDLAKKIKVRKKTTLDTSATPKGKKGDKKLAPGRLNDEDLNELRAAMAEAVAETEAKDPTVLRKRIRELEAELKLPAPVVQSYMKMDWAAVHRVLDQHASSYTTFLQKFAEVFDRFAGAGGIDKIRAVLHAEEKKAGPSNGIGHAGITRLPDRGRIKPDNGTPVVVPNLPKGAREMLYALRLGSPWMTRTRLGLFATIVSTGGTFGDYLSKLRTAGLILEQGDKVALSDAGKRALGETLNDRAPSLDSVVDAWRQKGHFPRGARAMFDAIVVAGHEGLTREELGKEAGISHTGGTFGDYLSKIRTKGLIEEADDGIRIRLAVDLQP